MTSLTIQLDDAAFASLLSLANARDMEVTAFAEKMLAAAAAAMSSSPSDSMVSQEVLDIIAKQIEIYRPVFRRLAQ